MGLHQVALALLISVTSNDWCISREFYQSIKVHYADPSAWVWQMSDEFKSSRQDGQGMDAMWTFEPKVAEQILSHFVQKAGVSLFLNSRLDRKNGVIKQKHSILEIRLENEIVFRGNNLSMQPMREI